MYANWRVVFGNGKLEDAYPRGWDRGEENMSVFLNAAECAQISTTQIPFAGLHLQEIDCYCTVIRNAIWCG